ncbi:MAG: hypothetical protein JXA44_03165 [Methanospirillaceae archaeon]|nr:hypothetical protein [Methanospirillaceae archaeon]
MDGKLFTQKARSSRDRFWSVINYRYLSRSQWIISDICDSLCQGERSPDFLSLLLHDEGLAGEAIGTDSTWRISTFSPEDVSHHLNLFSQQRWCREGKLPKCGWW